ncbi:MAG TPA: hypothetical protein PKM72_09930 [Nitrospirales bacterium]|nr:hypothetical protein [Nitrospirales bacterium]
MNTDNQTTQCRRRRISTLAPGYQSSTKMTQSMILVYLVMIIVLLDVLSGCNGPSPYRLQAHFASEPEGSQIIKGKISTHSQNRLPVGMAIVMHPDSSHGPLAVTEDSWPQFAARVKREVQGHFPVSMYEVVRVDGIPSGEKVSLLEGMGGNSPIDMVLIVLPTAIEIKSPAKFDLLPEVSMLTGYQTENHATVELGLLDLQSGKLLLQSQGNSYATLDQLDVPLSSNRYPRVRGSAMTSTIYPEEGRAFETLRMVALEEALNQAVMKLTDEWHDSQGGLTLSESPGAGEAS